MNRVYIAIMKIGILGAGLTGILTAYYLKQRGISSVVIEARRRPGGRIFTLREKGIQVEMGATWFGPQHSNLAELLQELAIDSFPQYQDGKAVFEASSMSPVQVFDLPEGQQSFYRIKGGTDELIRKLMARLDDSQVVMNNPVKEIWLADSGITIKSEKETYDPMDLVISTLPPSLLVNSITFNPKLDPSFVQFSNETHTWMGNSIKFAVSYPSPFWRENGFAGVGFSNASIASEIHDHVNFENNAFALKGFLSPSAVKLDYAYREKLVINQLKRFYGKTATNYIAYHETLWAEEQYTMGGLSNDLVPHQNAGNPQFQQAVLNGKLIISGSETSPVFGGYMEGAVYAAKITASQVFERLKIK
ncbi:MAG: FAD-dependent oxidoreductase [Bacteroidota bacterium]